MTVCVLKYNLNVYQQGLEPNWELRIKNNRLRNSDEIEIWIPANGNNIKIYKNWIM